MSTPQLVYDGPSEGRLTVALAHGAGAAMDTPFMQAITQGLVGADLQVVRFEFPYMAKLREDGKRRGPDTERVLLDTWRSVIEQLEVERLVIGGKSLGGRMASMVAQEAGVRGLLCLGYPFHVPGKPERIRTAHLMELSIPTLIVQGTRDPFGGPCQVANYRLSEHVSVHWLEDGEHSFTPRKSSGRTEQQNLAEAVSAVLEFLSGL